jgi:hypothetical protein
MAKVTMNARIYLAEVDVSGISNAAALNLKTDIQDGTCMKATWKEKLPGIPDVIADVSGYFEALAVTGNPDKKLFDQIALADAVLSICQGDGAFGNRAWFFQPVLSQYTPFDGKVGEVNPYKLHAEGALPFIRGRVLAASDIRTLTGAGTKYNLGAYSATQTLYGALHVFAASAGDTLDVVIAIADRLSVVTINAGGSGYSGGDVLTVVQSGGSLGTLNVDTVGGSGEVTGVSIVTPGSGYAVANGLSTTVAPPGGTGCKINITAITDTTVITFAQKAAIGHELATDAGPITDVNFKAKWTIGGAAPSFTFAVLAGIV